MKPQLTLQTPLELPPQEISNYLNQLWISEDEDNSGANTFTLMVWQPAWLEQCLVQSGLINGPITGTLSPEIIKVAKKVIVDKRLPHTTSIKSEELLTSLKDNSLNNDYEDLRGQFFESSISTLNPRRLITLAPTFNKESEIKTFVSAYCPLSDNAINQPICGDLVVIRGDSNSIKKKGLKIIDELSIKELPTWLWWNGSLDESPEIFNYFTDYGIRLIVDTANGSPNRCLKILDQSIRSNKAINDLNWLRLKSWRESLAMIFDPPSRRPILDHISDIDIDIAEGNLLQALFLISWISDKLEWVFSKIDKHGGLIKIEFKRDNGEKISTCINPLPLGNPSIHSGQVIGLRLISKISEVQKNNTCVILGCESVECMRLEAGGMADMQLIEQVVPNDFSSSEFDVSKLLGSSRGNTSPLFENAIKVAVQIFNSLCK
ncbi:Putative glucose 6-phosphate dehydrogenase effector OpcA [Prochlorococcus marinus str. MIT 9515]|uniref:Putative glucose 6-phosphate dehydrogenase effector OpcA n=1 Tax=Prochlorococcus marinus (strain MIT 9515) TaxID=167542 RepID=A2BX59_PROM5|nr:glucose-6-phosphate dehydrogenase assembly protein OpcA [Prochlorococcus marinus]ABM72370.1 Putative glucose 6-phosphate dehydrogenase effector OpcA [Prochlorococcus marinus str. MIT 9515]